MFSIKFWNDFEFRKIVKKYIYSYENYRSDYSSVYKELKFEYNIIQEVQIVL